MQLFAVIQFVFPSALTADEASRLERAAMAAGWSRGPSSIIWTLELASSATTPEEAMESTMGLRLIVADTATKIMSLAGVSGKVTVALSDKPVEFVRVN